MSQHRSKCNNTDKRQSKSVPAMIAIGILPYVDFSAVRSQVNVAQNNNIGAAIAYSDKDSADRTKIASVKTPLRPVSGADGLERVDDQPLMATGLDLNGPPKRFSAKEMLENLETPGF